MATTANPPPGAFAVEDHNGSDPFVTSSHDPQRQRYSAFDKSQFSLYLNGSPAQAKRALQAHLAETTRRLQETSHLGNSLVQQRKELEEKLKEVEKQEEDTDIGPELRQRLAELEKEFNEVGRETARAFLPKSRVPSGEAADSTAGASVYSSEAHHSPSKVSVPRINDIALATEISTSLLAQLKDLQAVLSEKDEALKAANLDRSQLEIEVEGLSQRLRTIDESESRLKDVNWNLETQVRDFEAQSRAAADKEHRMNNNLNLVKSEKAALEREFEELKQLYSKLSEDHVTHTKQHETELSGLRRNVSMGESERATQNQELARAVAYRMRGEDHASAEDTSPDEGADQDDTITPEHSPPPSPSKATPRHGQLESETLKHSLHHAHRMIQQLKNNIHHARDELESNRSALNGPGNVFKKPARPDRLGALRAGTQEVIVDDEDRRPRQVDVVPGAFPSGFSSAAETSANEGFETANETSDAAFETANERDGTTTETDAFQTGAETLDGDSSDELTETEAGPSTGTVRQRPSSLATSHRDSYESTASTSGDEWDDNMDIKTPVRSGAYRRSTPRASQEAYADTPPVANDSPASFVSNSNNSTPAQGKSLFAELGALSAGESEDGSVADGTPSRSTILKPALGRSPLQSVVLPRPAMVDSSMMTEPWEPAPVVVEIPPMVMSSISAQDSQPISPGTAPQSPPPPALHISSLSSQDTVPQSLPLPSLQMSNLSAQGTVPQSQPHTAPQSAPPPALHMSAVSAQGTTPHSPPMALGMSSFATQATEPTSPVIERVAPPSLAVSSISHQTTEPTEPHLPPLSISRLFSQSAEPVDVPRPAAPQLSSLWSQATEPVEMPKPAVPHYSSVWSQATEPITSRPPRSQFSALTSQATEPLQLPRPLPPQLSPSRQMPSEVSAITTQHTEPYEAPAAIRPQHRFSDVTILQDTQPESPTLPSFLPSPSRPPTAHRVAPPPLSLSTIASQETEPSVPSRPSTAHRVGPAPFALSIGGTQTEQSDATKRGFFSSVLPWSKTTSEKDIPADEVPPASREGRMPLALIASNVVQNERGLSDGRSSPSKPGIPTTDEGTQTMVSAEQIDRLLLARNQRHSGTIATAGVDKRMSPPASPSRRLSGEPGRTPRRPGSSSSMRSRTASQPPLPPDHKEVIAAASLKSPAPLPSPTTSGPAVMGPPAIPASAYKKRPQTPTTKTANVPQSPKTGGTTPRPRYHSQTRSGATSPITRRSSVSSFSSEIDHRFNIPGAPTFSQSGLDADATDPRMIQAITQTMIGEFLWKYTRKAGREGMSENRHRRFFWVHPYTRTLYWSEQDPASAGRAQLKAKSVAIEAVHEISDDNPYPPGLHRKSLVVITPGRTIKFTATTSQRHETWFNALLYLLKRAGEGEEEQKSEAADEIQNEFNAGYSRSTSRQTGRSRASLSSYASRRASSPHHAQIPTLRQSTASDITSYEEPSNSAADLSREMVEANARDSDRMEMVNVRACCDGKHDVGHLHHTAKGRHNSFNANSRPSLIGSMSSRSHSRAESRNEQIRHQTELEAANASAC
ncbi:hypothetical protein BU26DRAFT_531612 [Trematosphaeria pertusa]|uniref:PH domain-containing protein n=1 Tax=Trematosphaeria pertusa TaxID=390896 RepID=A0A6A6ICU0_9PLEO|nr:uncharacterized protein BU26DRAFT_531612 [Trematosphaeria pertusa]KAF2248236.1 hypothetical protein BU26DRAFT_531612 [Trematosphaeria pertusa]